MRLNVQVQQLCDTISYGCVTDVDTVTGPFDVIAMVEADDLNALASCITGSIQTVAGVKRTTTCLSIALN